ncbi:alpha-tocopherol transfer protein-like [Pieris rapae]|uniref:alpha-tocopherol transfer protein-like n=1 Tax=Pieris rapae TaxID=64459 RepID=UPI001E2812B8|nr:alpha-tocopherol transfer protein-like [Pieris rapae]XP_022115153.2 alpha-tocopherol transfer protein-like [Pieris rapae]
MEKLTKSPILEYNPKQVDQVRETFHYNDIKKLYQDLDNFEDWIKKQNHFEVKEFDRDYLERFLIASKGSVEIAKKRFDKLCTLRTLMPEFLRNFDVKDEFSRVVKWNYYCILPKPTNDNYRVLVTAVHNPDAPDIDMLELYRFAISLMEYILQYDYNAGFEVIFDTRMYTFGVVTKFNPIMLKKCTTIFLEALGFRLKRMHVISGSKLFDIVFSILKSALTEKLVKRIIVHDSVESLQNYISKDILPVDFGGTEKSLKDICEATLEEMRKEEHVARLKFLETAGTDESKRLNQTFNEEYSGMPGSFKSLCVD